MSVWNIQSFPLILHPSEYRQITTKPERPESDWLISLDQAFLITHQPERKKVSTTVIINDSLLYYFHI